MSRRRARAAVMMYHRVSLQGAPVEEGDYALSSELFERQMDVLATEGWPVVSLSALASGDFPDRAVALTFDDGCETDLRVALPRLRHRRFPAAFFLNPALVGAPGRLSWDQVAELAAAGMQIGSHGLDHTLLDGLPTAELERQLATSKSQLEQRLGREVEALSLPGGSGGARALAVARRVGYRLVLGSRPGLVRSGGLPDLLPRYAVRLSQGVEGFQAAVEQRLSFRLRQRLRYRGLRLLRGTIGGGIYRYWRNNHLDRLGTRRPGDA
jgi:peptidoglycan/xylan/chitin deacetylase (PgdA/CDA1 family)